jgi:hypothetical protein
VGKSAKVLPISSPIGAHINLPIGTNFELASNIANLPT